MGSAFDTGGAELEGRVRARLLGVVWHRSQLITIDHDAPCPLHSAFAQALAAWRQEQA